MKLRIWLLGFLLSTAPLSAFPQEASTEPDSADVTAFKQLQWQLGPGVGAIGDKATVQIPTGGRFLNASETAKYEALSHNLPTGEEYLLIPSDFSWEAHFQFSPEGYVKDDEKLDPDAILQGLRDRQVAANAELSRRGWRTLTVLGWQVPPRYDPSTHVLEWAVNLKDDSSGATLSNYSTRMLGRKGVTSVTVVVGDLSTFNRTLANFKETLPGFSYVVGERYAEYVPGDHVAEYGLAALITGGVVAVAAKKGFFGVIAAFLAGAWKLVIAAFVGLGAWIKSLFAKKPRQDK